MELSRNSNVKSRLKLFLFEIINSNLEKYTVKKRWRVCRSLKPIIKKEKLVINIQSRPHASALTIKISNNRFTFTSSKVKRIIGHLFFLSSMEHRRLLFLVVARMKSVFKSDEKNPVYSGLLLFRSPFKNGRLRVTSS